MYSVMIMRDVPRVAAGRQPLADRLAASDVRPPLGTTPAQIALSWLFARKP
jgi:aryl-alcohol dehydrogenase-like predicted oxidoreductase